MKQILKIKQFALTNINIFIFLLYAMASFFVCRHLLRVPFHRMLDRDNLLTSWTVGWNMHSFLTDPLNIFNANIFYPNAHVLTYSEGLFAPSLMALPIYILSGSLIFSYNILIFFSFFLSALGMFLLTKHYTKNTYASFIAGIIFSFATYRIASLGHFQNLMIFWMPFGVLFLQKYLETFTRKFLIYFSLFFIAQVLSSWYNGAFFAFFILFFLFANYKKILPNYKLLIKHSVIPFFLVILFVAPFAYPYFSFNKESGSAFSIDEVTYYSADLGGYFLPSPLSYPGKIFSELKITKVRWSENINFLGYSTLVIIGLYFLFWKKDKLSKNQKIYGSGIIVFILLSFGPFLHFFDKKTAIPLPYHFVYSYLPFLRFIRVPGRLSIIALLCLSIFVALLLQKIQIKNKFFRYSLAAILPFLIFFEGYEPQPSNPVISMKPCSNAYDRIKNDPSVTGIIEFPLYDNPFETAKYIFDSTCHYKPIFNGYSGYTPPGYNISGEIVKTFPSKVSIGLLRTLKINRVVLHADALENKTEFLENISKSKELLIDYDDNDIYVVKIKDDDGYFYLNDFDKYQMRSPDSKLPPPTFDNVETKKVIGGRNFSGLIKKDLIMPGHFTFNTIEAAGKKSLEVWIQGDSYSGNDSMKITTLDENKNIIETRIIQPKDIFKWDLQKFDISKNSSISVDMELLPSEDVERVSINSIIIYLK